MSVGRRSVQRMSVFRMKTYKYQYVDDELQSYDPEDFTWKEKVRLRLFICLLWVIGLHIHIKKGERLALGGNNRIAKKLVESLNKDKLLRDI
jgi:hypothetical protein